MQAIRNNLRNHSDSFITGAQVHCAYKAQVIMTAMAKSRLHKKTISKARHARRPVTSEFFDAEPYTLPVSVHQIKTRLQEDRISQLDAETREISLESIPGRKPPPSRAEPLLVWRGK
jgi:hypothetical protein